jgi:hypothetical protein
MQEQLPSSSSAVWSKKSSSAMVRQIFLDSNQYTNPLLLGFDYPSVVSDPGWFSGGSLTVSSPSVSFKTRSDLRSTPPTPTHLPK